MMSGSTLTVGYAGIATVLEISPSAELYLPTGVTLYVSDSGKVDVDAGANIECDGFITTQAGPDSTGDPGGQITNSGSIITAFGPSTVTNNAGGTITNSGTFNSFYNFNNAGTITNNKGGSLGFYGSPGTGIATNSGTINNNQGATMTNEQSFTNTNTGTIANSGTFTYDTNDAGGNIVNKGMISNTGTISFDSVVANFGTISNLGSVTFAYHTSNSGTITNNAGGFVRVWSTLNNNASGVITNVYGATFINGALASGALVGATLTNMMGGTVANSGSFTNFDLATISNSGTINNACNGTFRNDSTTPVSPNPVVDTCQSTQAGSAAVSSGSVPTQSFPTTGISVGVSGTSGATATINTQQLAAQPSNTGTVSLGPASGAALKFYDLSISGITGGTAHTCVSSAYVGSKTLIEYYSAGAWSAAAAISDSASTNSSLGMVCGDIPVASLTGSPLVIGDPQTTTSSTVPEFPTVMLVPLLLASLLIISFLTRKNMTFGARPSGPANLSRSPRLRRAEFLPGPA